MSNKFVFNADNITDVDPIELDEKTQPDIGEVEDILEEHNNSSNPDPTNASNFDHPDPEIIEPKVETVKENNMINGAALIFMIDTVFPLIIKYSVEATKKGIVCDLQVLKMDHEEKELLGPSAEKVAEIIFGNMGPVPQFLIGLSVIYASKIPDAIKKVENE